LVTISSEASQHEAAKVRRVRGADVEPCRSAEQHDTKIGRQAARQRGPSRYAPQPRGSRERAPPLCPAVQTPISTPSAPTVWHQAEPCKSPWPVRGRRTSRVNLRGRSPRRHPRRSPVYPRILLLTSGIAVSAAAPSCGPGFLSPPRVRFHTFVDIPIPGRSVVDPTVSPRPPSDSASQTAGRGTAAGLLLNSFGKSSRRGLFRWMMATRAPTRCTGLVSVHPP
jgi:hypothetical protein